MFVFLKCDTFLPLIALIVIIQGLEIMTMTYINKYISYTWIRQQKDIAAKRDK